MTLLINYRPVPQQVTGIGVYAQAILPALQSLPHRMIEGGEPVGLSQRLNRLVWTQRHLRREAKAAGAGLIFTPAPEGYLGHQEVPQIVMVHDLRPLTHPELSFQTMYFRSWVPALLRSCKHVVTNSNFTAAEIQRTLSLMDHKVSVIPLGFDASLFYPKAPPHLPKRQYLLHVGQAYPHKNIKRLIEAFALVANRCSDLDLVLAGKPHPEETGLLMQLVDHHQLQHRVFFRPYVLASELPDLYRGALAFIYPSLWEGFGLPVLEAMACGVPVVTSLGSGTEEVAADAALLVDPFDTLMLADAIVSIVDSPGLRSQLMLRGLERSAQFCWQRTSQATAALLGSHLGNCR